MTRVDFYHLQRQNLEDVLPKLLEKAYEVGKNILVRIGNEERVEFLNALLWTYDEQSFLPHGSRKDGNADFQPIWLSADQDNPNQAAFLFLTDGANIDVSDLASFERVFNIFDGNTETAVQQARIFWKKCKNAGAECFYWQQDENGRWSQKS